MLIIRTKTGGTSRSIGEGVKHDEGSRDEGEREGDDEHVPESVVRKHGARFAGADLTGGDGAADPAPSSASGGRTGSRYGHDIQATLSAGRRPVER